MFIRKLTRTDFDTKLLNLGIFVKNVSLDRLKAWNICHAYFFLINMYHQNFKSCFQSHTLYSGYRYITEEAKQESHGFKESV